MDQNRLLSVQMIHSFCDFEANLDFFQNIQVYSPGSLVQKFKKCSSSTKFFHNINFVLVIGQSFEDY